MTSWGVAMLSSCITTLTVLLINSVREIKTLKRENAELKQTNASMARALEARISDAVKQARIDGITEGRRRTIYAGYTYDDTKRKEKRGADA